MGSVGGSPRVTGGDIGLISAALMTAVGGYLDAFLFLRHQVFGFAQTGNVVFLAVALVKGDNWSKYAWPLLAYLAGLVAAQVVRTLAPDLPARLVVAVLGFQLVVFVILACLPSDAPEGWFVIPLSFVGGIRLELFRSAGAVSFVSIATTGNLMRFVSAAADLVRDRSPQRLSAAGATFLIAIAFLLGALCGAAVTDAIGPALWGAVILEGASVVVLIAAARAQQPATGV
ncbi:YoaK family protein [Gordonia jinhuaensis]|uniref:DUF1275 domain-containing protein n=1 Tax=Gordonia jinhuaensis TaxID=1517702 RepID=A0A916T652_9ACTN|nr:YoaK family protein [Gordonia jinhuaensis]GGB31262.1 hypothetical protein GCM10011489_19310 [Gordonia jinhuaensis]